MAYKLLVADDEYWVREKFRHIIDWSRYDIEFLEPVCDGLGVLECLEREKLDILITDTDTAETILAMDEAESSPPDSQ